MAGFQLALSSCQSLWSNLSSAPQCCPSFPGAVVQRADFACLIPLEQIRTLMDGLLNYAVMFCCFVSCFFFTPFHTAPLWPALWCLCAFLCICLFPILLFLLSSVLLHVSSFLFSSLDRDIHPANITSVQRFKTSNTHHRGAGGF